MSGFAIDEATRAATSSASDPEGSAWVSANAGSGKTYVLTQRVVRLLLAGTDPARILCLTFTKAAAAEMSGRIFDVLAEWTRLSDDALAARIAEIEGSLPSVKQIAEARRLFVNALETPGGLKIQTIHAFCERLLHQFPFEANVAGHFEVLEERDAAVLAIEARRHVLTEALHHPDGRLGRALSTVLSHASDTTYEEALAEFIQRRDRLRQWISRSGAIEDALRALRHALELHAGETLGSIRALVLSDSYFSAAEHARLMRALTDSGKSTDSEAAGRLASFISAHDPDARIDAWLAFFRTGRGEMRKPDRMVTKGVRQSWPELADLLTDESKRLESVCDRIRAAQCYEASAAMLQLADGAVADYERRKARLGVLDFEDLIVKTAMLLSRSNAAQWIQYKLDRGIDHILVDEAQDTNPRQWEVIRKIAEDFFAGEGASQTARTLFAVGDEKQSIFSFQGAVPRWFTHVQREVGARARAGSYRFSDVQLHLSFRSTQQVLSAVDKVFESDIARAGVTGESEWPYHTAARHGHPGRVVIWPMIEPPKQTAPDDWASPLDHLDEKSPEVVLAERIAATIRGWLDRREVLDATAEPVRPGGILILTRTRGAQSEAINRALKQHDIPIAGADRLNLVEHIAAMDLMALGRVMLLPEDDLSLAALLRSPLIGFSEDDLFRLAHGRAGTLWESLGASEEPAHRIARERLEAWRSEADYRDPHAFFARVLGPSGGRLAFLRRLGPEAEDVLDEFLSQALAYERANTPSLQGFLAWLEAAPTEIKRESDKLRNEVRVMTVHGAKGLEADIVFLVDTGAAPVHARHDPKVVPLHDDDERGPPSPLVWMSGRKAMPPSVANRIDALRKRSEEEYRRLLYVAMTRARDRLYVCGTEKRNTKPEGWHGLVRAALEGECQTIEMEGGAWTALEWRASDAPLPLAGPESASPAPEEAGLPAWAAATATPPPAPARRVSPSSILRLGEEEDDPARGSERPASDPARQKALKRGTLIHRLLQSLPGHPARSRESVGARFLEAAAEGWTEAERAALLAETLAILAHPDMAPVFAPGSRAEVEIAGRIRHGDGEAVVSGRIDRLMATESEVFIVDYKTNRPAPRRPEDVPPAYIAQLAAYAEVLSGLYPGRAIVAALLWTDHPSLMRIPAEMLDSVMAPMLSAEGPEPGSAP